jgi:hypothetical protein
MTTRRKAAILGAALAVAAAGLAVGAWALAGDGGPDRQALVAERGALVMPFDLERTTHVFAKSDDGGVQTVTADDPTDAEQTALIRSHLREEAAKFRRGEMGDPAAIHGMQMPGLAELEEGFRRFEIVYEDVPAGARIVYRTEDPALVRALHHWFDAQVMDHGDDARDA